jgi:site-specific recombinase XerD
MDRELADFVVFCRVERRLADATCRAYERDIRACLEFPAERGGRELRAVRAPDLRAFLAAEAEHRPARSSQARAVAALKGFLRFCAQNEYLARDPALVLGTPKKREALPDVLDRGELGRLLAVPDRREVWERRFAGRRERDRLLLALLAYAGLRRAELLGLDWDDVDLARRLLRVRHAKGGRQRVVPIHSALVPLFVDYLAVRMPLGDPALFVGVQGRRLSTTILATTFRRYAAAAGRMMTTPTRPHSARPRPIRRPARPRPRQSSTPTTPTTAAARGGRSPARARHHGALGPLESLGR